MPDTSNSTVPILEKDNFQADEPHWRRISKNTISLFQVLIDLVYSV